MAGRYSARRIDGEEGWVKRRFREAYRDDVGTLQAPGGSSITIEQVLQDPNGSVAYIDSDETTALADDADVTLVLTYIPIAGSLKVFQNGTRLASEFTRANEVVTIPASAGVVIRTADRFTAWYVRDTTSDTDDPAPATYDAAVLAEPTLLGYWRLAESSGTVMEDSSGNGRHGTYSADVVLGATTLLVGDPDTSAHFPDGTAPYGTVPHGAWMDVPEFSIECWAATDAVSSGILMLPNRDTDFRSWFIQSESGGGLRFAQVHGGSTDTDVAADLDDTDPHYVAVTYDGADVRLYIDGTEVQSAATTGDMSTNAFLAIGGSYLGGGTWWAPYFYKGRLGKVAYYSGAQSAAAILNRYQIGAGL